MSDVWHKKLEVLNIIYYANFYFINLLTTKYTWRICCNNTRCNRIRYTTSAPGYAADIQTIFYFGPQFAQESDMHHSYGINNPVTNILKVLWHGWYVHIIFHESPKRKVPGCRIGCPWKPAATNYLSFCKLQQLGVDSEIPRWLDYDDSHSLTSER
jgi:hypothetical protein